MLPAEIGGVVIGALPLVSGLYIFSKGAGIETTVNRVIQEMRDNADAAMFSSLLWTATVFSAIFAVAEGYQEYTNLVADSSKIRFMAGSYPCCPSMDCYSVLDINCWIYVPEIAKRLIFWPVNRA